LSRAQARRCDCRLRAAVSSTLPVAGRDLARADRGLSLARQPRDHRHPPHSARSARALAESRAENARCRWWCSRQARQQRRRRTRDRRGHRDVHRCARARLPTDVGDRLCRWHRTLSGSAQHSHAAHPLRERPHQRRRGRAMRAALVERRSARARDQTNLRLQRPQRHVERGYPMTGFSEDDFEPRRGNRREQAGNGNGAPRDDDAEFEKIKREVFPENDAATVRAALEKASKDKVVELFIKFALAGDLNAVEIDALLRLTAKKAGVGLRPLTSMLKQARDAQEAEREQAAKARRRAERRKEAGPLLAEMNRDNCVVLDGSKVWVLRFEQVHHNLSGRRYSYRVPIFLRRDDFRTLYMNRLVNTGEKFVELGQWWLRHRERRQYLGVVLEPGGAPVIDDKLNLWTGGGVKPKRCAWRLMRGHFYEGLAGRDEDVDTYIINWLAWAVQHPNQQPEAALVFLGERGTGRGVLGNAMCRIFGNHALHISSPHHLTGHFNAHLRQCAFLFADEAYAASERSAEGRLKALITEPTIPIEAKGKDVITAPNHLHVMMASNEDWVVPAGRIERRFVVSEVTDDHAQDPAYFKPLFAQMNEGGLEAMLFDLLQRDLGDFHPRQIVRTDALARQQAESLPPFDAWWEDLLHDGHLPAGDSAGKVVSGDYERRKSEGYYTDNTKKTWFEKRKGLYEQARIASPELKRRTDAAFGRYLVKRGCTPKWVLRQRGWQFPPLEQCRAEWIKRFPATVWRDPEAKTWQGERDQDDEVE